MFRREVAPGIEIKLFEPGEEHAVFAVVERNRQYLREWLPWVDRTHSAADIRAFIDRAILKFETAQAPDAGIWVDGAFAGTVGCHPIDWANRSSSVGYWVDAARQGQGLVTRATATLLDYLFHEQRLHRVEIRCGTGNHRSCAIPNRLGFTREGIAAEAECVGERWIDLVVWSMLDRNWRPASDTR
jgi:ribosomal-protein-serine acetyltransferase